MADSRISVWVKWVGDSQYGPMKARASDNVSELKDLWLGLSGAQVQQARVFVRLVRARHDPARKGKPSGEKELNAAVLEDPSSTLTEAGVFDGAWLLFEAQAEGAESTLHVKLLSHAPCCVNSTKFAFD